MTNLQIATAGTAQALPPVRLDQDQPLGLCSRMAYGVVNCAKKLGLGGLAAGIITPLATGVCSLAKMGGLIPKISDENDLREVAANYKRMGFIKMDADKLIKAPCYMEELARQLNSHKILTPFGEVELNYSVSSLKAAAIGSAVIAFPIIEEILFRGLMQDVCLTRIPKYVIKKIAPGKETILDTTVAKAARILLTSTAFSAYHLQNQGIFSDSYVQMQLVATFATGIGFGLLKESKAGLLGAVGAHMANNFIAISPKLLSC